jgi:hypothetical protein
MKSTTQLDHINLCKAIPGTNWSNRRTKQVFVTVAHGDHWVGEVSQGDKMHLRGTDPESYITVYTVVHEG